jgi:hypothetical protein
VNKVDVAKLLTLASTVDNRTVAPETVEAWHRIINGITYAQAEVALWAHFRTSTAYLLPAHIMAGVANARRAVGSTDSDASKLCRVHWYPTPCPFEHDKEPAL